MEGMESNIVSDKPADVQSLVPVSLTVLARDALRPILLASHTRPLPLRLGCVRLDNLLDLGSNPLHKGVQRVHIVFFLFHGRALFRLFLLLLLLLLRSTLGFVLGSQLFELGSQRAAARGVLVIVPAKSRGCGLGLQVQGIMTTWRDRGVQTYDISDVHRWSAEADLFEQ